MGDRDPIPHLDLYAELEVEPGATLEAIEAAYRAQMKRSHPDLAGPGGLERSKRLNLARSWLTDPGRRARYDASRRARTTAPATPAARRAAPAPAARRRPAPRSPRTAPGTPGAWRWRTTAGAHRTAAAGPRRRRRQSPAVVQALAVIAVIGVLVVAGVIIGLRGAGVGGLVATQSPTLAPTASPPVLAASSPGEPTPRATSTETPTVAATAIPSPSGAAGGSPHVTTGTADLRFSGDYVEHDVATLGPTSSCTAVDEPGESPAAPHGFRLASGPGSPAAWSLELDDTTGSWTMGMSFDDPALDLYWLAGSDPGSVSPSASGYAFDVQLTGATASIRVEGSVSCGPGGP